MNTFDILTKLAVPRPNGSMALDRTVDFVSHHLTMLGAQVTRQEFYLRPYMQPVAGLAFLLLGILSLFFTLRRRYLAALIIALIIPAIYFAEFEFNVPVVSWIGGRTGVNIIADFPPENGPADQHIAFSAHYDSKTDLFDHEQRKPIHSFAPIAMACLILAAGLGAATRRLRIGKIGHRVSILAGIVGISGIFMLALAFGGGMFLPEHRQSPGARDNGSGVAVLMSMAEDLASGEMNRDRTAVRLIFFGGEEVNMQGSHYYAKSPSLSPREMVINLELVGGSRPHCYWASSGTFLSRYPASPKAVGLYKQALNSLGLPPPAVVNSIFDDSGRLLASGFDAVTLGHADPNAPDSYHNTGDNLDKVVPERLEEMRMILLEMVRLMDRADGQ